MENNLTRIIGSGVGFPIILKPVLDKDGKPTKVYTEEGGIVESTAWVVDKGDPKLIIQNLTQVFVTMIGQLIRREDFGSRIHDMLEEPNNQLLTLKASTYISEAISNWETRVTLKNIYLTKEPSKLIVRIDLVIGNTDTIYSVDYEYKLNN